MQLPDSSAGLKVESPIVRVMGQLVFEFLLNSPRICAQSASPSSMYDFSSAAVGRG
jgi:hypothetical protein